MADIAFIGLGNMGLPMAANLVKAGHHVTGHDPSPRSRRAAGEKGIHIVENTAAAVDGRDTIITMLPNGEIVLSVFGEILPAASKGALVIDSSTIDVASARRTHERAAKAGLLCVDAPVSGGVGGAEAGSLTFMVGGSRQAFERARPVLDVMGGRIVHCGEGGAGQSAKICNNMLLGISMIGACEAFALAEKLGLSQQALFDVVSTSSGSCWSVNSYCPVPGVGPASPADNDYRPGFAAGLMLKDLRLSQEAAGQVKAFTPMGSRACAIYTDFVEDGNAATDFSGIINHLKKAEAKR